MNNIYKNLIKYLCFILTIVMLIPIFSYDSVYADIYIEETPVDEGKESATKTKIRIYNLAIKTENNTYELAAEFMECGYDVETIQNAGAGELTQIAADLGEYAYKTNIGYDMMEEEICYEIKINVEVSGAYLVLIENISYYDLLYSFQPILCLADAGEDVIVKPKVYLNDGQDDDNTVEVPPVTVTPNPEFPNTGMNHMLVYMLVAVGVLVLITVWGMMRRHSQKKHMVVLLSIMGMICILFAGGIVGKHYIIEKNAEVKMKIVTDRIKEIWVDSGDKERPEHEKENALIELNLEDKAMEVCEVDGSKYVGVLEIPSLSLELPIGYDCTAGTLKSSPGRFAGWLGIDTFVIGAHHYESQFGLINTLVYGDKVYFTDVDGGKTELSVASMTQVEPYEVSVVCDSGYDLALFTCNYNASKRIIVYCQMNK